MEAMQNQTVPYHTFAVCRRSLSTYGIGSTRNPAHACEAGPEALVETQHVNAPALAILKRMYLLKVVLNLPWFCERI